MNVELEKQFYQLFTTKPEYIFFCPGRVNLIGEHIDYNGGEVLPCAISLGTYVAIAKNNDKVFRFRSLNFPEIADLEIKPSYSKTGKEWFNYPLGIINQLLQDGHAVSGLNMLFYGNLPVGAGLSSSASIEVLTGFALQTIFEWNISNTTIALLSQKIENEFIGVNCGIMDQFAVAMGKANSAILLNCDTLDYEYLPFETEDHLLTIVNSNKQRALAESKYNERFTECRKALMLLKTKFDIENLCDMNLTDFETNRRLINNSVLEKRAWHVISENERVKEAKEVLSSGRLDRFGELMYASHQSLKEMYEVSGKELDTIVEFCSMYDGCIGARMTGAGFGGCAIALIKEKQFDDFASRLSAYYKNKIGYDPGVFASAIGDGVRRI